MGLPSGVRTLRNDSPQPMCNSDSVRVVALAFGLKYVLYIHPIVTTSVQVLTTHRREQRQSVLEVTMAIARHAQWEVASGVVAPESVRPATYLPVLE
jgi:hypothetical protein